MSSSPLRPRSSHPTLPRHVIVRVTAASCRRSRCRRPFVCRRFVVSVPAPAVASRGPRAARPPSSRLSPLCRRVIASSLSEPPTVERSSVAAERPLAVALVAPPGRHSSSHCASSPPSRRRSLSSSSSPPSSLPSPSSSPPSSSSTLSVTGRAAVVWSSVWSPSSSPSSGAVGHVRRYRRLSLSGRHRRPPPVAAVVVVDPRLYPHPSSCSATLPPASLTWDWDVTRRRRRVVVVLAAALWSSSSSSGLVLAAAGWQCFDVGAGQGTDQT